MREKIEQVSVYGSLLVMLALLIVFGISAAEKGVNSLVGQPNTAVQTIPAGSGAKATANLESQPRIVGKHITYTKKPWSEQVSRNLDGQNSYAASLMDNASLHIGTMLQGGAKALLTGLSNVLK